MTEQIQLLEAAVQAVKEGRYDLAAELAYTASIHLTEAVSACPNCGSPYCGVIFDQAGARRTCEAQQQ